ncbi:hypothetical protein Hanom_Chr10g00961491 [Helianthus anomalus]
MSLEISVRGLEVQAARSLFLCPRLLLKSPHPPTNDKGSLSKHLKTLRASSSLVRSSKAPILIPAAPASSQAKGKAPEDSAAQTTLDVEASSSILIIFSMININRTRV